jgi:hypothetical protein
LKGGDMNLFDTDIDTAAAGTTGQAVTRMQTGPAPGRRAHLGRDERAGDVWTVRIGDVHARVGRRGAIAGPPGAPGRKCLESRAPRKGGARNRASSARERALPLPRGLPGGPPHADEARDRTPSARDHAQQPRDRAPSDRAAFTKARDAGRLAHAGVGELHDGRPSARGHGFKARGGDHEARDRSRSAHGGDHEARVRPRSAPDSEHEARGVAGSVRDGVHDARDRSQSGRGCDHEARGRAQALVGATTKLVTVPR